MNIGEQVWFRGALVEDIERNYAVRGVVEHIEAGKFGVRLENGNFKWCVREQLKHRELGQ